MPFLHINAPLPPHSSQPAEGLSSSKNNWQTAEPNKTQVQVALLGADEKPEILTSASWDNMSKQLPNSKDSLPPQTPRPNYKTMATNETCQCVAQCASFPEHFRGILAPVFLRLRRMHSVAIGAENHASVDKLTDWLEFNGTFNTIRLYRAFRSYSSVYVYENEAPWEPTPNLQ